MLKYLLVSRLLLTQFINKLSKMNGSLQSKYSEYWKLWRNQEKINFIRIRGREEPPTEKLNKRLAEAIKIKEEGNALSLIHI